MSGKTRYTIKQPPKIEWPSLLQSLRAERKLTQKALTEAIGRPRCVCDISWAENGNYTKPGLRRKLAQFYGVDEPTLFDENGYAKGQENGRGH